MADLGIGFGIKQLNPTDYPFVAGVTEREGVPTAMRYFIHDRLDGTLISAGKSNASGIYKRYLPLDYFQNKQVFVIVFDDMGVYNAQVADLIEPLT